MKAHIVNIKFTDNMVHINNIIIVVQPIKLFWFSVKGK